MILGQTCKSIVVQGQATVASNATASYGPFDISGYGHVVFRASFPPAAATNSSAKWGALSVLVGDTTDYTSATAVAGLVGVTTSTASTSQFVLGVYNNTSYGSITRLTLSNNKHKYAFINAQPAASTVYTPMSFQADCYHAAQAPNTATEAGCVNIASSVSNNPGTL
jgi:hypothetical protein